MRPGLDQPPPLLGDGERDNDMLEYGVPGIEGKGWALPPAPDVAPSLELEECEPDRFRDGVLFAAAEEVRRRRCPSVFVCEA